MAFYFNKPHEVITCLTNMTTGDDVEDSLSISYHDGLAGLMGYNGPFDSIKTPNLVKILEGRSYRLHGTVMNKKTLIKYNYNVINSYTSDRGSYRLEIETDASTFIVNLINDIIDRRQEFINIPQNKLATYYRAVLKARSAIKYKKLDYKYDLLVSIYCSLKHNKRAISEPMDGSYVDTILEMHKDFPELVPDFSDSAKSDNDGLVTTLLEMAIHGFAMGAYNTYKDMVQRITRQSKLMYRFMEITHTLTDSQIAKLDQFDLTLTRTSTETPNVLLCSRNISVRDVVRIHTLINKVVSIRSSFRKKRKECEARING